MENLKKLYNLTDYALQLLEDKNNYEKFKKSTFGFQSIDNIILKWVVEGRVQLDVLLITILPELKIPHLATVLENTELLEDIYYSYILRSMTVTFTDKIESILNLTDNSIHKNYDDWVIPIEKEKLINWGILNDLEAISSFYSSKLGKIFSYYSHNYETEEEARKEAEKLLNNPEIDIIYFSIIATPFKYFENEELFFIPKFISSIVEPYYDDNHIIIGYNEIQIEYLDGLEFILQQTAMYDKSIAYQ